MLRRTFAPNPRHAEHIDLDNREHVRSWTRAFGCNERQLREAVLAVGTRAELVRAQFRRRSMTRRPSREAA
jgi:hypothetical protein